MRSQILLLSLATGLLAGCTVGPDYAGPPKTASDAAGGFVRADAGTTSAPPVADWWKTLGDPHLDALITRALADNTDIRAAEARLRQARAALGEQRANSAPKASASALYAHAHIPGANLGSSDSGEESGSSSSDLNLYNVGFDASWEIDLFGGQRRAVEAARAQMEGTEASLADVQVSISANVAQSYLNLRDRQQRIALGEQSVAMQQDMLALTRQRFDRGTATAADVAQAESQLDATRARISLWRPSGTPISMRWRC
ncbi:TolC family protein [Novosphingobium resinovorum]